MPTDWCPTACKIHWELHGEGEQRKWLKRQRRRGQVQRQRRGQFWKWQGPYQFGSCRRQQGASIAAMDCGFPTLFVMMATDWKVWTTMTIWKWLHVSNSGFFLLSALLPIMLLLLQKMLMLSNATTWHQFCRCHVHVRLRFQVFTRRLHGVDDLHCLVTYHCLGVCHGAACKCICLKWHMMAKLVGWWGQKLVGCCQAACSVSGNSKVSFHFLW